MSKSTGSAAEKETTIWATLRGQIFLATLKTKQVRKAIKWADGFNYTEQHSMQIVADMLETGERGDLMRKSAAAMLLWAACRCPAGKTAEAAVRKGGKNIGWNMAYDTDGRLLYGLHVSDGPVPDVRRLADVREAARVAKDEPMMCVTGSAEAVGELAESMGAIAIKLTPDEVTPHMAASMLTLAEGTATAH
jgi:hypothetical protein